MDTIKRLPAVVRGNDFTLALTLRVRREGQPAGEYDPALLGGMRVTLVGGWRRVPVPEARAAGGRVVVPVGGEAVGCGVWGVEVTGTEADGRRVRSLDTECFVVVADNAQATDWPRPQETGLPGGNRLAVAPTTVWLTRANGWQADVRVESDTEWTVG